MMTARINGGQQAHYLTMHAANSYASKTGKRLEQAMAGLALSNLLGIVNMMKSSYKLQKAP